MSVQALDIERIKKYNADLKEYTQKGANVQAELSFTEKELASICAELTQELGVEVTPENLEQIYQDRLSKVNNTLQVGEEVLARIKQEELENSAQSVPNIAPVAQQVPQINQQVQQPTQQVDQFASLDGGTGQLPNLFAPQGNSINI